MTPYQRAVRWKRAWYAGMTHYGHLCAAALAEDDLSSARDYATRYDCCCRRFMAAWGRELAAENREGVRPACVDWYGDGDV